MKVGYRFYNGQAKTKTLLLQRLFELFKPVEDKRQLIFGDAQTAIGNSYSKCMAGNELPGYFSLARFCIVFDGVVDEIKKQVKQQEFIYMNQLHCSRDIDLERYVFFLQSDGNLLINLLQKLLGANVIIL